MMARGTSARAASTRHSAFVILFNTLLRPSPKQWRCVGFVLLFWVVVGDGVGWGLLVPGGGRRDYGCILCPPSWIYRAVPQRLPRHGERRAYAAALSRRGQRVWRSQASEASQEFIHRRNCAGRDGWHPERHQSHDRHSAEVVFSHDAAACIVATASS